MGLNLAHPLSGTNVQIKLDFQGHSRFRSFLFPIVRKAIFIPVPKYWECVFSFPKMQFFTPVPKIWEWVELFPFMFPKYKRSFPLTHVLFS